MKEKQINNNQLTVRAGLSIGLIGAARKKMTGLHSDNIEKILTAYPELDPRWLFTGKGSMLITDKKYSSAELSTDMVSETGTEYQSLIRDMRDTISFLKEQLEEAKKDRELLRELLSKKK